MADQFQQASDEIFAALKKEEISQEQAEELQKMIFRKYRMSPAEKFTEANDEALALYENKKISEAEFKDIQGRIRDKYSPDTTGERHPDIKFPSRLGMKMFGNDPEKSFQRMQEDHPNMQFRKDSMGNILAKNRDETKWGYVDPPDFDPEDITDLTWDAPAAVAEGVMSTIGGVKGALFGAPAGPPGMAAGALTGASLYGSATAGGLDAANQFIGQALGYNDKIDSDRVITASKWGALPAALGTGATTKQIAKAAAKSGISEQALKQSQRGLLDKAYGYGAGKLGQLASGVDSSLLQSVRRNLDEIKDVEAAGNEGAEIYGVVRDKVTTAMDGALSEAGEKLGKVQGAEDVLVDVATVEKPLLDLIGRYQARAEKDILKYGDAAENMASVQKAQQVESILQPYIKGEGVLEGGYDVKDYLDDINDLTGIAKGTDPSIQNDVRKQIMNATRKSASLVNEQAAKSSGGKAWINAKKDYSELLEIKNRVKNKHFKDDEATERTVNSLLSRKKKAKRLTIKRDMEKLGVDIDEPARESIANSLFVQPSTDALSLGGSTSTSRTVPLAAMGGLAGYQLGAYAGGDQNYSAGLLGGAIGSALGSKLGSPAAMRAFMSGDRSAKKGWSLLNDSGTRYPMGMSGINLWKNTDRRDQ